jgi:hypothetical protein
VFPFGPIRDTALALSIDKGYDPGSVRCPNPDFRTGSGMHIELLQADKNARK